jgi:hypothetical protein
MIDDRAHAPRGSESTEDPRHRDAERPDCTPTRSMGTIRQLASEGARGTKTVGADLSAKAIHQKT